MVMVVPSEAAKDIGINNLEAGILFFWARLSMDGSMMAVIVM